MSTRSIVFSTLGLLGICVPGLAQPRFVEDRNHIAIIEHDGSSYDRRLGNELNVGPRQRLAREFIATHGDLYDFIVVYTNFDFDRGEAIGFYLTVRNDTQGIGEELFDNGAEFGSPERLQGVIDMGPVSQYRDRERGLSTEPVDPEFRASIGVLAHEIGHRWLAQVRYFDGNEVSSRLLGRDGPLELSPR